MSDSQRGPRPLAIAVFFLGIAACLHPLTSAGMALLGGIAFSLAFGGTPFAVTKKASSNLLGGSLIGLGAAVNIGTIVKVGASGVGYTLFGILATFALGALLARLVRIPEKTSVLVSAGTAICGGSAIAAVSPAIDADHRDISVAMATVFILNGIALYLFPVLGETFGLSQTEFGLWGALAIHDTSSVVGAAMAYGGEALDVATTVKLARAAWILPVTLLIGLIYRGQKQQTPSYKPLIFLGGFFATSTIVSLFPALQPSGELVAAAARRGLVASLFLIGTTVTLATLKNAGAKTLLYGLILWLAVGTGSLLGIATGVIG